MPDQQEPGALEMHGTVSVTEGSVSSRTRAGARWLMAGSGFAGVVLFALMVRRVGWADLVSGVGRIGWGFFVVLALGGLRFAVRTFAWVASVPAGHRLSPRAAFEAVVASDALGTLIPAGPLASEPAKVMCISPHLPVADAVASVAIENLLYTLSAGLMIAGGAVAVLQLAGLQESVRIASVTAAAVFAGIALVLVALACTRRRPVRGIASWLRGRSFAGAQRAATVAGRLVALEARTLGFAADKPGRWLAVFGLELAFHALAVIEIWLTLQWVLPSGTSPTLMGAFVLESTNRLITVMFKFVPFRIGVDEAGTGAVAALLALGPAAGVTVAVIRKGRTVCWTAVGVVILLARGWFTRGGPRASAAPSGR